MEQTTIIPKNLIEGANDNSFFDRGNSLERDAQTESEYFASNEMIRKTVLRLCPLNEEQTEILDSREAGWRELIREQYTARASFNASNVPWFIAGPAKFNNSRYQKRLEAAENKFNDFEEKKERYIKNTVDMLEKAASAETQIRIWREGRQGYGVTIASDDPLAVEKMEAHIEHLKELHELHLKINAYVRKNGTATGCDFISQKVIDELNGTLERMPFAVSNVCFTANETADIRNKTKRLEQLKAARALANEQKENGVGADMEKDGLRLQIDHEAARVQLVFDGKPDEAIRAKLKANGFRWSPRFGAWQRQNTPNGIAVARKFFEEYSV